MQPDEIETTYEELGKMFIALDSSPEKGLTYIRERLTLARAMQDRVAELRLKVNRALSSVMEQHLIAQQVYEIQSTPDNKKKVKELEVLKHRHVMLTKMIVAQSQVLSRTAMDIRLLADLTKEQIKRGEIDPHEAPGLVKEVEVGEMARPSTTEGGLFGPSVSAVSTQSLPANEAPSRPGQLTVFGGAGDTFEGVEEPAVLGAGLGMVFGELPVFDPASDDFRIRTSGKALAAVANDLLAAKRKTPVESVGIDATLPGMESDTMKLQDTHDAVSIDDLFKEPEHGAVAPIL